MLNASAAAILGTMCGRHLTPDERESILSRIKAVSYGMRSDLT